MGVLVTASPQGGAITVWIRRASNEDRSWVTISVEDQGIGIANADLPHIFERFRRGKNVPAKRRGSGPMPAA